MTTVRGVSRRRFLQTTSLATAGYWVAGGLGSRAQESPNERLAFACVGIEGKGHSDSNDAGRFGDVVAICDVDTTRLASAARRFPKAKTYQDYRRLLDEMGDSIDAVTVSTSDHMHAPIGIAFMKRGKHCFCQKPLTRSVWESRRMGEVAREMKVATQMGNQGTAGDGLRREAHWLKHGAIGPVRELHVWTNRPIWPQGIERPAPSAVPANVDWDAWLGVAPERPYASGYHPFNWRGWWDFGTGALGDIACHTVSMPFMGLDLRNPIAVSAVTSGHNKDSYPAWSIVTFEFAATDQRPAVKLVWYDGGKLPSQELLGGREPGEGGGCLAIGDKGILLNGSLLDGAEPVEVDFPRSPGHVEEWIRAIRGGEPAVSNFPDYAGPLTEAMLAGNLAVWLADKGESPRVEWDGANMKCANIDGLEELVRPTYRKSFNVDM